MTETSKPSPAAPPSRHRSKHAARERRVLDYFFVVRDHWLIALLVAGFIFGGFVVWTLYTPPVYEARATIQLQDKGAEQTLVAELSSVEKPSSVETEMEVMRSFAVAKEAASDPVYQMTCVCWEKHAYRHLASLERRLGRRAGSSSLQVRTSTIPVGVVNLELRFDDSGSALTVVDAENVHLPEVRVAPFVSGTPFDAFGYTLTVETSGGPVAGKTFTVWLRPVELAARWLLAGRTVEQVGKYTGIASISFTAEAPEVAQSAANALAYGYLRLRGKNRDEDLKGGAGWLEKRIIDARRDSEKADQARDEYMLKTGAFELRARANTVSRDQTEVKLQIVEALRLREAAQRDLERWRSPKTLEERLGLLVSGKSDPLTSSLATEYTALDRSVELLKIKNTPDHPLVVAEATKLGLLRRQLEARLLLFSSEYIDTAEREVARLDEKVAELQKTLDGYKKDLEVYPKVERELLDLDRNAEAKRRRLEQLQARQDEVGLSGASDKIPAKLVDEAQPPSGRKAPNLMYMLTLGLIFGALGGIAAAFAKDSVDHKVRTPEELEDQLGLSNYSTIPAFSSVRKKDRRTIKTALVALEAPRSVITEAYRSLRANIRFATTEQKLKALAITSAVASEGKTVTTLNLAIVLAEGGSSVVVIDADLRRSMVHEYMKAEREPGLSEVLTAGLPWTKAIQHTQVPKLDVLTSGSRHERPASLLDSKEFEVLLEDLRKAYDYVLVDMPPVLAVSDAAPFFGKLDGVLLLCRAGKCPVGVYQGAAEQVERLGGRILGTIFNGIDARRGGRGSRYGYGGYYGYYGYYGYDERRSKDKPSQKSAKGEELETSSRSGGSKK